MNFEPKINFNQATINLKPPQNPSPPAPPTPTQSPESLYATLITLIKSENITPLQQFLATQKNKYPLLNKTDPHLHQNCIYTSVQIKDPEKSYQITKLLINSGANVKTSDIHGQSPLFYIAKAGKIRILHLLLGHSIDLNETDHFKQTPLFYASREGNFDIIKEMIKNGSNPNHKDKIQQTALFYAAREGRVEICKFLVENGADVNGVDLRKQTAIFFARSNGKMDVVKLLVDLGGFNTKDGRLTKADLSRLKRKSVKLSVNDSKSFNNKSVKRKKPKDDHRVSYKFVFTNCDLNKNDVSENDFLSFKKKNPYISHLLLHPEILETNQEILAEIEKDTWQSVALKILSLIWKAKGASIFHNPVDHVKLNIPDYPEKIKNPMDFGTIKKKLNSNLYKEAKEFVKDLSQVFLNCKIYNGIEGYVGEIGFNTNNQFQTLLENYKFLERFGEKKRNFEEFLKTQFKSLENEKNTNNLNNTTNPVNGMVNNNTLTTENNNLSKLNNNLPAKINNLPTPNNNGKVFNEKNNEILLNINNNETIKENINKVELKINNNPTAVNENKTEMVLKEENIITETNANIITETNTNNIPEKNVNNIINHQKPIIENFPKNENFPKIENSKMEEENIPQTEFNNQIPNTIVEENKNREFVQNNKVVVENKNTELVQNTMVVEENKNTELVQNTMVIEENKNTELVQNTMVVEENKNTELVQNTMVIEEKNILIQENPVIQNNILNINNEVHQNEKKEQENLNNEPIAIVNEQNNQIVNSNINNETVKNNLNDGINEEKIIENQNNLQIVGANQEKKVKNNDNNL